MTGQKGPRYAARFANCDADLKQAQRLRQACFRDSGDSAPDSDTFDDICAHVLVEHVASGTLVCCFRLLPMQNGSCIAMSYSAQFYDLGRLAAYDGPMVEMGRFCIHPEHRNSVVLRVAWAAMTEYVEQNGVEMLFGCSSFSGTESDGYMEAFTLLKDHHLGPVNWLPRVKAPTVFRFAEMLRKRKPDLKAAMRVMPPLLRTYLAMGGWVSDHAVVDTDLRTLHVFTGLEVKRVPQARRRALGATTG